MGIGHGPNDVGCWNYECSRNHYNNCEMACADAELEPSDDSTQDAENEIPRKETLMSEENNKPEEAEKKSDVIEVKEEVYNRMLGQLGQLASVVQSQRMALDFERRVVKSRVVTLESVETILEDLDVGLSGARKIIEAVNAWMDAKEKEVRKIAQGEMNRWVEEQKASIEQLRQKQQGLEDGNPT